MENYRSLIVLICVVAYMAMCIGVGIWAMRRTKSSHDFFMAGRHLGVIVAGVAVFSSTMSGWGFVGGPGLVYKMGTSSFWMIVCTSMAITITFYLLGKRLRLLAELRDPISLPDAVYARYGSRSTSLLTAVAILLGVMGYLATQILAMATVLQSILENVSWVGSLSLVTCVAISSTVLVFYCVTGGIIASVYTDLVQGIIMVIAAVLILVTAIFAVDGGLSGMSRTILADDPEAMSPWGTLGMIGCLSWYFIFVLGACGQPHVITKLMMTRRVEDARHMLPVSVVGYGISALLWIGIGLAMRALVLQGIHPELANADDAASEFLQNYAHPPAVRRCLCGVAGCHYVHRRQLSEYRCGGCGARHSASGARAFIAQRTILGANGNRRDCCGGFCIRPFVRGPGGAAGCVRLVDICGCDCSDCCHRLQLETCDAGGL